MNKSCLPKRLKALRLDRNLTQRDVYNAIDMSATVYNRYEAGDRLPALEQLATIADYFSVSVDYLIGRTDNPEINR